MGTTPKGFPYPEPTDPVAAGADAIKALAQAIDTHVGRVASGAVTVTGDGTSVNPGAAVTFPAGRFTANPRVIAEVVGGSNVNLAGVSTGITTTGCTVFAFLRAGGAIANGTNVTVNWIAVQAP